jgi:hypothetical protein
MKWLGMILVLLGGCQQDRSEQAKPPPAAQCFRQLKRSSPGRLVLRQPLACEERVSRYQLEGTPERPARVTFLDPAGKVHLTYRIQYGQDQKPIFEERVYHSKPPRFKVKGRTDRVIVGGTLGGEWKPVTIRTELDERERPKKTEKFVGADRAYSVVREYAGDRLKSESTFDGGGKLKFRSDYLEIDGKRIERMVDGAGKVLMERILDTPGVPPVQHPEIE